MTQLLGRAVPRTRGRVSPQVALKSLEKYCQTVKRIRQWDLDGKRPRACPTAKITPAATLQQGPSWWAAVTAGPGPWWLRCPSSFTWSSLAEVEGRKGTRVPLSHPSCDKLSRICRGSGQGTLLTVPGAASRLCPYAALATPACQAVPSPAANSLIAAMGGF